MDLEPVVTVAISVIAAALSYGGMRVQVKRLDKDVSDLEKRGAAIDVKIANVEGSHGDLKVKHSDGMAELRPRMERAEARINSVEQGAVENRAEMRSLAAGVARIEAKQDRESQALEQIRRDILSLAKRDGE